MSSYSGRRAPNVSQYLANLNTINDSPPQEELLATDDLSLFATTEFFDFDMGDNLSNLPPTADFEPARNERKASTIGWQDAAKVDFLNSKLNLCLFLHALRTFSI
jgi:hypothetical protein